MTKEEQEKEIYERWREVPSEQATYVIVLHPGSYDTSVLFYKLKEDAEWALQNSWFDEKKPLVAKIVQMKTTLTE